MFVHAACVGCKSQKGDIDFKIKILPDSGILELELQPALHAFSAQCTCLHPAPSDPKNEFIKGNLERDRVPYCPRFVHSVAFCSRHLAVLWPDMRHDAVVGKLPEKSSKCRGEKFFLDFQSSSCIFKLKVISKTKFKTQKNIKHSKFVKSFIYFRPDKFAVNYCKTRGAVTAKELHYL